MKDKTEKRVQKFRSIEDMNKAPLPEFRTPDIERFLRHCARFRAIAPKHYARGVFKFRSIEEAQKARELNIKDQETNLDDVSTETR